MSYLRPTLASSSPNAVKEVLKDSKVRVEELTDTVFAHASDTKTPQGILCVVEQMNHEINELTSAKCPLIMVLDMGWSMEKMYRKRRVPDHL